ncbi:MAG TPA: NAD(P)-dependent alcohol dehydrogenase [Verrucomicrobiae bacterium]|nr:NAD(P)-dependent alcohol dehydrogenase [Verrucomicrobiae bacterium]
MEATSIAEEREVVSKQTAEKAKTPLVTAARAYGAGDPKARLGPLTIRRREPRAQDIEIEILFCGVCHSDLHTVRGEWGGTTYPCVPGHEIIGRVLKAGRSVKKFREGDVAAVGCMVDSCRTCPSCREGLEQFCENVSTFTYNGEDRVSGGITYGGYSERIVVDEAFALRVASNLDMAAAAPLLCAGITTYSPLRHWKVKRGQQVGVVGLGGLGHMAVKFANAFGAEVTLFTTSTNKRDDALKLGAHNVVISKDADEMHRQAGKFDFILNTVSASHDLDPYLQALKRDGTMTLVGAPPTPSPVAGFSLIMARRQLAGSLIGGIPETQEMLDFCAERGIVCEIEKIPISQINEAYERMLKSDVKYRFVIDMASLK